MTAKPCRSLVLLTLYLLAVPSLQAQTKKLTAAEAKDHIGDRATVCGKVVSTHYAKSSKGEPTFLNLDEPHPKRSFHYSDLGIGSRKVRDARRRVQRLAGVRDRKDNKLSGPAGDCGY